MTIRLKRPSADVLRALRSAGERDELTYAPVGISLDGPIPDGFRSVDASVSLGGRDDAAFQRAVEAIRTWSIQRGAGLQVEAGGPPTEGAVVAMSARLPLGYIDVVCRVVRVIDEDGRFGFAYGTLPNHPACGEESFVVHSAADGAVRFDVSAVSRPRQLLARAVPPITRRMQRGTTERYLDAMRQAVAGPG